MEDTLPPAVLSCWNNTTDWLSVGFYDLLHKSATECSPSGSMSILSSYLQRRGDTFSFRIAVPRELRQIVGKLEFIKSLQTTDKRIAVPQALSLAATAKQSFINLKCDMSTWWPPSEMFNPSYYFNAYTPSVHLKAEPSLISSYNLTLMSSKRVYSLMVAFS